MPKLKEKRKKKNGKDSEANEKVDFSPKREIGDQIKGIKGMSF